METNSAVITLNPVEYTEKMRKVLGNFRQLSQQATAIQAETAVFNADINNLALEIYSSHGEKYAVERIDALLTTEYTIIHLAHMTMIGVRFVSSVEAYNQQMAFEVNTETGEIVRTDVEYVEDTLANGVVDRAVQNVQKPVRSPIDILSHMNTDMYLMGRNHASLALGRIAS